MRKSKAKKKAAPKKVTALASYIESWMRLLCPHCQVSNWVCQGDVTDCTGYDPEVIRCWKCGQCFLVDSEGMDFLELTEDSANDGKESPT